MYKKIILTRIIHFLNIKRVIPEIKEIIKHNIYEQKYHCLAHMSEKGLEQKYILTK